MADDSQTKTPEPLDNHLFRSPSMDDITSDDTKTALKEGCCLCGKCSWELFKCGEQCLCHIAWIYVWENTKEGSCLHCMAGQETGTTMCELCGCMGAAKDYVDCQKDCLSCICSDGFMDVGKELGKCILDLFKICK